MEITSGTVLEATTASGEGVRMVALGAPEPGKDFAVVWVVTEQEWENMDTASDTEESIPWPLDSVRVLERA